MGDWSADKSQVLFAFPSMLCPPQFHLSHSDKELLEREDRGESQQEILRRIAKDLPIYTRTNSGGTVTAHGAADAEQLEQSRLTRSSQSSFQRLSPC